MEEKQNENDSPNDKPAEEILDFNKPDFQFVPKGSHQWRQQGPYIICKSCELEHATYIGMDYLMTGIGEDGFPLLKVRT
jgi:hypothetical protein